MTDSITNKNKLIQLLRSTNREGIEQVIQNLEELGFFEAPASSNHHLSIPGGLVLHSLNVCELSLKIKTQLLLLKPEMDSQIKDESIIITSLLHDVCKAEIYKPAIKKRKMQSGFWQEYQGYEVDYSRFPMGHGEKSVIRLLQWGLKMSEDEMLAIRWHMAAWDLPFQSYESKENINKASEKCPLLKLIQAADGLASGIIEK